MEKTPSLLHCGSALLVATDEGIPRALRQLPFPSVLSLSSVKLPTKAGSRGRAENSAPTRQGLSQRPEGSGMLRRLSKKSARRMGRPAESQGLQDVPASAAAYTGKAQRAKQERDTEC